MKQKREEKSLYEKIRLIRKAGLDPGVPLHYDEEQLPPLSERIKQLQAMLGKSILRKPGYVMFFIMYDIENNRVRRYIAKYLIKKGYVRVQKSVFFGNVPREIHNKVCETLKAVNDKYENGDSLLFLPVSQDMFHNLKVVGQNLSYELSIEHKSTLIF